jgi:pyrrolysine biosynthesis protein PylD
MTRLTPRHLSGLSRTLRSYDAELRQKTGRSLKGIGLQAAGLSEAEFTEGADGALFCIVPMTSGQGAIPGFCEAVRDIVSFLDCRAEVASSSDVAGIAEAFRSRAEHVLLADDQDFIALNAASKAVVHNDEATAKAYVAALRLMLGPSGGKVLVLGCGPVGRAALAELLALKHPVAVYDASSTRLEAWRNGLGSEERGRVEVLSHFPESFVSFAGAIDATPAQGIIDGRHMHDRLFIAAPGVPLGITAEAMAQCSRRVVHDPLQLGVAAMIAMAVKEGGCCRR